MWRLLGTCVMLFAFGTYAGFVLSKPAEPVLAQAVSQPFAYPYLSVSTQIPVSSELTTQSYTVVQSNQTVTTIDRSVDARLTGLLSHVKWLMSRDGDEDSSLTRRQVFALMDDIGDSNRDIREEVAAVLPDGFTVDDTGTVTTGIWQGAVITDAYVSDTLTLGASSTIANGIITPNALLAIGQTDEYCLTYEATGAQFEWEVCGSGMGLTSSDIDTSAELAAILTDETGTGATVFANSPILVTPNLGTPTALTLTNATGLPVATGLSGLGVGVAAFLATPSSVNLATALTDETGTGSLVFSNAPTFTGTAVFGNTGIQVGASVPFSDSVGTLTLQNIDLLDATTETTIETAIDTLANLTSASALTTVGTITSGTWQGSIIGDVYITKTGDWTGTLDGIEGSAFALDSDIGVTIQGYNANTSFLGNTINVNELAIADFGDFTCNGTTCALDTTYLVSGNIDTSSELAAILTDETGTGNVVFSASPTFSGTLNAAAATFSNTLSMSGANIALGANWLSGDGGNEGIAVDATGFVNTFNSTILGGTTGNHVALFSTRAAGGSGGNTVFRNEWRLRDATGTTWETQRIHDGISVDVSFLTPGVDTRVWWERDPFDNIQSWGDGALTYLTINAGNVGIGTTSPAAKFAVNGTALFSNTITQIGDTDIYRVGMFKTATGGAIEFGLLGQSITGMQAINNLGNFQALVLQPNGGNVGIGTTTPTAQLALESNSSTGQLLINNTGASNNVSLALAKSGVNQAVIGIAGGMNGIITGSALNDLAIRSNSGSNKILFSANSGSTAHLSILSSGNVGIGTSTPVSRLHVFSGASGGTSASGTFTLENSTSLFLQLLSPNNTQQQIRFGDNNNSASGLIRYDHSTDNMSFFTNGSSQLSILSSGNVGIGTTTPSERLVVSGNIRGDRFIGYGTGNITSNSAVGAFSLNTNTTGSDNTAIGVSALRSNTTGYQNTALGKDSLQSNITGAENIAIGFNSLFTSTSTTGNLAIGNHSLFSNTTGNTNFAIGNYSLSSNTTGNTNFAAGHNALNSNTTGSGNVALGDIALISNVTGSANTALGASTLVNLTTGDQNIALGINTGGGITTGSYNTILGSNVNGLSPSLSNNIIIADGQGNRRINVDENGNVGIGTTTPNTRLSVLGDISVMDGKDIRLYNSGNTNWSQISSPASGAFSIDTGGVADAFYISNGGNVGIGTITPNHPLHVIGEIRATRIIPESQSDNVAVGEETLLFLSPGPGNTAVGTQALRTVDGGQLNTAVGYQALFYTEGSENTALGATALRNSLGSNNIGIGFGAGSNMNGNLNIAIGYYSGENVNSGSGNILIGAGSGEGLITGSNNTIIGNYISSLASNLSNNIIIADGAGNRRINVDASGNVGIGTTNPTQNLEVIGGPAGTGIRITNFNTVAPLSASRANGTQSAPTAVVAGDRIGTVLFNAYDGATFNNIAAVQGFAFDNQSTTTRGSFLNFETIASGSTVRTERMRINHNGNVGIGTTTPNQLLSISGANSASSGFQVYNSTFGVDVRLAASVGITNAATLYTQSNSDLRIGTNNQERLRITNAGNVGIGTTTPTGRFEVAGGTSFISHDASSGDQLYLRGRTGSNFNRQLILGYNFAGDYGNIQAVAQGIGFRSLALNPSGGNVGIGTTTPLERLTVQGNIYTSNPGYNALAVNSGPVAGQFAANAGGSVDVRAVSNHPLIFLTNNTEQVRVTATGNMGIGTTNPGYRLEVASPDTTPAYVRSTGSVASLLGFADATTSLSPAVGSVGNNLTFWSGGNRRMTLDNNGNFGIGTTTPAALLHLFSATANATARVESGLATGVAQFIARGDGTNNFTRVWNSGSATANTDLTNIPNSALIQTGNGNSGGLILNVSHTSAPIIFSTGGQSFASERMRITSSGNVGIGTTTPNTRLNVLLGGSTHSLVSPSDTVAVFQNSSAVGSLARFNVISGTDGQSILQLGDNADDDIGAISYNNTSNVLSFRTNNVSDRLVIDASGNVGIGTTGPSAQLHTTGSVRFATFGAGTLQTDANGNVSVSSDERLKDIERPFESGLAAINGLEPIIFKWSDASGFETETEYLGFSAQNVQDFIPEAVGEDTQGFLTLSDRGILATVVNAIKELWELVQGHGERIETLERENEYLKERLETIENELDVSPIPTTSGIESDPSPAPVGEASSEVIDPPPPSESSAPVEEPPVNM